MITEDRRLVMMVMWVLMWAMMAMASATELVVRATEQVEWKDTRVYGKVRVEYGGEILIKNSGGAPEDVLKTYGYMEIVGNDVELLQGGRISASKAKFLGPPRPEVGENHGGIGGSYGGRGGAPEPDARLAPRGTVEGADIERGGSGGDGPGGWRLGREAGGSLIIRGENVSIDGVVESNGRNGEDFTTNPDDGPEPEIFFGGGGASGGGILIIAKHLTIGPNARITANGGDGGDGLGSMSCREGFPGGGGRIKIFYEDGTISEQAIIETKCGKRPDEREDCGGNGGVEDGTVYIEKVKTVDALLNPGDLNNDGKTDYKDLLIVQQNWHKEVIPIPTAEPTETPTPQPTATSTQQPSATPTLP